ncbi:MAG TPA: OmpA family protein [Polyangia bacterium]|nr:OmpA family protein [Polyangia bacterium]
MRAISFSTAALVSLLLTSGADAKGPALAVQLTKNDIDLAARTISFRLNRPAESAELTLLDEAGNQVAERVEVYGGAPAGTVLTISWPELPKNVENYRIDLKFSDIDDFWVGLSICRFQGYIPHEEVVFESGKWEIRPQERSKLDEATPRIIEMVKRSKACDDQGNALYVAGYTDTVGSLADNRELSRKRARAIAEYLLAGGLAKKKISVYVRGFGEEVLAVSTGDSVDEERNRRADYIVSNFPPALPGPGAWVRVQ